MEKQILSRFNELPKLKTTWLTLVFSIITILLTLSHLLSPLDSISIDHKITATEILISKIIRYSSFFVPLILAFIFGLISQKKGERSWVLWLGLLPAIFLLIWALLIYLSLIF